MVNRPIPTPALLRPSYLMHIALDTAQDKGIGPSPIVDVSLVIPCFNEADGLEQLEEKLHALIATFSQRFNFEVVLVDDGSSDDTKSGLSSRFADKTWTKIEHHAINRGIAAAMMTGIKASSNELVVTMDADCTYDPMQIDRLFSAMQDGTAVVTASPYHPEGVVDGVPHWRLGLSRVASSMYRGLLKTPLHTYTSCFRLHRRSYVVGIDLRENGFVGVAEMLWKVLQRGGVVTEVPARLTSRRIGYSKMRTLPVIAAHLKLMTRIAMARFSTP